MFAEFLASDSVQKALSVLKTEFPLAIWETLYVTVAAMFFAVLIGLPLGVLLVVGEKDGLAPLPGWLMKTVNVIINLLRSVPFLILMILLYAVYAADTIATAFAASDLARDLDALEKVADSMHAVSDAMSEILGTTAMEADQKMDENRLQFKLAAAEARDAAAKLNSRDAYEALRLKAEEAKETARRASEISKLNAAEAAKAVKLAAQGKAEQTTAFLQLEQLKEELAARAQVMQAHTRRGTHLLGKGRMLRAYPKLKHGQNNRSLSSLLEQLEDEYPDSFNGFGIQ